MSQASSRLAQVIDSLGIKQAEFAKKISVGKTTVHSTIARGAQIKTDVLDKIAIAYPHLNIEWLVTGRGNMWKDDVKDIDKTRAELLMKIKKLEDRVKVLEYTLGTKENIIARRGVRIEKQEQYIAELEYRIKLMEEDEK